MLLVAAFFQHPEAPIPGFEYSARKPKAAAGQEHVALYQMNSAGQRNERVLVFMSSSIFENSRFWDKVFSMHSVASTPQNDIEKWV